MRNLKAGVFGVAALLALLIWLSPALAQRPGAGSPARPTEPRGNDHVYCCVECKDGKCNGCTEYYTGHKCGPNNVQADCSILSDKAICTPKSTSKPGREQAGGSRIIMRLTPSGSGATPRDFDIEIRNDQIVGVSVIAANGRRGPLNPQSGPTSPGPNGCGSGKKLNCWEDEQKAMSICLCFGAGDIKGTPQTIVN